MFFPNSLRSLPTALYADWIELIKLDPCFFLTLKISSIPPFSFHQKAANVTKESNIIYIRGGVYNQKVHVTHSVVLEAPITFQNYQDKKVILDGSTIKLEDDGLFTIEDKS